MPRNSDIGNDFTDGQLLELMHGKVPINDGLKEAVGIVLMKLTPREERILVKRIFLGETLREIGIQEKCTPERIRQCEAKALRKLRHPRYSKSLRVYLENG